MLRGTRVILRGFQCGVSTKREEHMTTANGQTPAPFMQDAPAVISTLGTDAHQGLTSEQAAHNLNQYGPNAFTKPKPESMLSRIVKTAADPMLIMLMIAAAITLGVNITRAMAGRPRRHSRMRGHLLRHRPVRDNHRGDGGSQRQGHRKR